MIAMTMAAACFPVAQLRVQEELDTVIGMDGRKLSSRLLNRIVSRDPPLVPDLGDWNALPQLHAFISEVLRWRPVTPLGKQFQTFGSFMDGRFHRFRTPLNERYCLGTPFPFMRRTLVNPTIVTERLLHPRWHTCDGKPMVFTPSSCDPCKRVAQASTN